MRGGKKAPRPGQSHPGHDVHQRHSQRAVTPPHTLSNTDKVTLALRMQKHTLDFSYFAATLQEVITKATAQLGKQHCGWFTDAGVPCEQFVPTQIPSQQGMF